jgi:ubiquinone/menaquinone biosynthesis C-methylase UbiE
MSDPRRTTPPQEPRSARPEIEQEIARLLDPGLRANAWRPDYDVFRQGRLWDEHRHGRRVRILRREWRGVAGHAVLDVGSGRGGLAVALARAGYRVVALDLRHSCCRVARLRAQRYALDVPAVEARAEHLPFGDETFGAVVCRDVMEHSHQPAQLLAEIWRVMRRGGSCFITVINRLCWIDPHYHLAGVSFLPRAVAERYVQLRGRGKQSKRDRQRLSEMHYYRYTEFVRWARGFGFVVRDLRAEQVERYRRDGLANRLRSVRDRLLQPLSLHAGQFEFLLAKPARAREELR